MEHQFVEWLSRHVKPLPRGAIGIGDDAAVLPWPAASDVVITTDAISDHVDFELDATDPQLVGRKALAVNLSDLAAMASRPIAALVSLVLPRQGGAGLDCYHLAVELYRGILALAERHNVAIAGGDTNTCDGPLVVSITALGQPAPGGPLTRRGAQPGDCVLVTGRLGGSILGRHLRFEPRVNEALRLRERYELHAGMDVSDGLALDASRLAAASGCGVALRLDAIPISADAEQLARQSHKSPLEHALGDGEDFELLVAAPPDAAQQIVRDQPIDPPVTIIGHCVADAGLWQTDQRGELRPLAPTGYQH